jgi:hypothetical protein
LFCLELAVWRTISISLYIRITDNQAINVSAAESWWLNVPFMLVNLNPTNYQDLSDKGNQGKTRGP